MATISNALDIPFTPTVGDFNVQCTGGSVRLDRRQTSGANWAVVGILDPNDCRVVSNPIAAADYRFVKLSGSPTVQADQ